MNEQLPFFDPPQPERDTTTDITDAIARSGDARNSGTYDPNRRFSTAAEDQGWGPVVPESPAEIIDAPERADVTHSHIPGHEPYQKLTPAEREIGRRAIRRIREGTN